MVLTMNGNPSVQGPMPPPPPPPPPPQFPGAGPQYHRGPAHQQMPAQASPHLQNFPPPGGAPHHGPPHGSHPNIPPHIGQTRPMEINQDGGRPVGHRQSFDGLTERLDKLNINSTISRKRKDLMDQDVVDINRLSGANGDTSVAYEGWTFYRAEPETADKKPTWARATRRAMLLSQDQLTKLVQRRKKKGQTAEEQYKSLGSFRRAQVDRLIEDRKRQDGDPRFDWHYISIDSKQRNVGRDGYETISMDVIVVKKPRSEASPTFMSPKATGKRIPTEVVDIHSPRTPTEDPDSDFDRPPRGGNSHAHPSGTIPLGPSRGPPPPPPLPRDVTLGPDRPMQSMPQGGQPLHQRRSSEMNPHVRILSPHEQNSHGQDGPMRDMPHGGPQIHPRGPEVLPHSQPQTPQGHNPHGPQTHQQPQPMNPQAPQHPQNFPGPGRPMQGMPQGGPFPQHPQHPQQRGPPGMNPQEPDGRMPGIQRDTPQGHPQGPLGMNQPHAPVPPPSLPNFHGPNKNGFGQSSPIQMVNGSGQLPQRRGSHHRLSQQQQQQIPQLMKEAPKEHQRQKSAPKVVNLTGKSPKDKGVERWLDESSPDEDDSELFELEDDSSATEDSYDTDEKFEKHIPGRGSLHPARRSSRSHGRNDSGYRTHRRTGHRYTGSDGHRYRYSRDSVDIVPARTNTNRALMPPPTRRASIAGPVRAPPRLTYSDRVERHDPFSAIAAAGFSPTRYRPREVDYGVDDRDLDLERDREFDLSYNEYMRGKMQDASDEILLRRRAAREAEYRELKEQSELMERMERMERLRRPHRDAPRYGGRRHPEYD